MQERHTAKEKRKKLTLYIVLFLFPGPYYNSSNLLYKLRQRYWV